MEYWIIINGKAQGPYGVDEMLRRGVTPSTPVWRQGMTEWVPAATVRELAAYFEPASVADGQPLDCSTPPPSPAPTPTPAPTATPAPAYNPNSDRQQAPQEMPAMPSTYLGWNIAATILCCVPAGIVGIIYSSMVRSKYNLGDYQGAAKASSNASLWFILSIVLGIIGGVFVAVVNIFSEL